MFVTAATNKARATSEYSTNIFVGRHTGLECEGSTRISRFTSDHTNKLHGRNIRLGKYDGIHMYSQAGAEALTKSILNIFQKAGLVKSKKSSPSNHRVNNARATNQPTSDSIQGAAQPWTSNQPASSSIQGEEESWTSNQSAWGGLQPTNQANLESIQGAGQPWTSNQPASSSIQGEGEYWYSSQSARGAWQRNPSMEVPEWEIPTQNRFQGFW